MPRVKGMVVKREVLGTLDGLHPDAAYQPPPAEPAYPLSGICRVAGCISVTGPEAAQAIKLSFPAIGPA